MKNRKSIPLLAIVLIGLVITGIQSCKKYPEGPVISFHSRAERVANTWKVDNYKLNGTDYTSLMTDYSETFSKSGAYSYAFNSIAGSGT